MKDAEAAVVISAADNDNGATQKKIREKQQRANVSETKRSEVDVRPQD